MSRQRHSLLHTSAAIISCSLLLWACGAKTDLLSGSSAQSGGSGGTSQQGGSGGTSQQGGSGGEQTGGSTSAGEGGGGAAGEAGTGGVAGGPIVRTILQRDPFENVDDPHNLLLNGGFEFKQQVMRESPAARASAARSSTKTKAYSPLSYRPSPAS